MCYDQDRRSIFRFYYIYTVGVKKYTVESSTLVFFFLRVVILFAMY